MGCHPPLCHHGGRATRHSDEATKCFLVAQASGVAGKKSNLHNAGTFFATTRGPSQLSFLPFPQQKWHWANIANWRASLTVVRWPVLLCCSVHRDEMRICPIRVPRIQDEDRMIWHSPQVNTSIEFPQPRRYLLFRFGKAPNVTDPKLSILTAILWQFESYQQHSG